MLYDEEMMLKAIDLAKEAAKLGECPVGAIIIDKEGNIIGEGYNRRESDNSPTAHAEILAIEAAAKHLGSWRLSDCTMYVTLEPCPMCAGAVINSRLKRIVYGAFDDKGGACASVVNLFEMPFNHKPLVRSRVLERECGELLKDFFQHLRKQ
ncbi:MAG: tRNA adenosine(34) deaminase TadA [Firmicutes bacterium]|nr:tRNA adenosine(34) deaminase TadA [[Eubacterium] siraeum]MCM1488928.1 tRNA adenosine(34) deaminase TadA [Bacillota bacterium]